MREAAVSVRALVLLWFLVASANAPPERPPIPEPTLIETISDIDAPAAGEIEYELIASLVHSRQAGAYELEIGPEIEWLATDRLGTFFELSGVREAPAAQPSTNRLQVAGGLSWKLLHDFAHDFHLQAELRGRYPTDLSRTEPGESALPFSLDVLSALRVGRWTLRNSFGASAGGEAAHVPLQGSAVVLTGFTASQRSGFWGIEAMADGAKVAPIALALEVVPDLTSVGLPFRFGLVGSYSFGAPATEPSWGILLRFFVESAREIEFDKRTSSPVTE